MIRNPKNIFWDSCVFIRYLTSEPIEFVADIEEYIKDARRGDRTIYYSTIIYAEIMPKHLIKSDFDTIYDFIEDLEGSFEPIDPTPNILADVGILRSLEPVNPNKPAKLRLGTPDAIHLSTCLSAISARGINDIVFQTFDATPGNGWEGENSTDHRF